jgi:hypothetical protein
LTDNRNVLFSIVLLAILAIGTVSGCGSQSKEAVKPDTFAPAPPSDSPSTGGSAPAETAEG